MLLTESITKFYLVDNFILMSFLNSGRDKMNRLAIQSINLNIFAFYT